MVRPSNGKLSSDWSRTCTRQPCTPLSAASPTCLSKTSRDDREQLLDLNVALEQLAEVDEREAKVVTLRFFGGLTVEQAAEVIGVSKRTVENDWRHAQAWLRLRLSEGRRS